MRQETVRFMKSIGRDKFQNSESRIQNPESRIQNPESRDIVKGCKSKQDIVSIFLSELINGLRAKFCILNSVFRIQNSEFSTPLTVPR